MVSGGVGGVTLWIAIFPFDVVKSRVQVTNTSEPMIRMLLRIARTEGSLSLSLSLCFVFHHHWQRDVVVVFFSAPVQV